MHCSDKSTSCTSNAKWPFNVICVSTLSLTFLKVHSETLHRKSRDRRFPDHSDANTRQTQRTKLKVCHSVSSVDYRHVVKSKFSLGRSAPLFPDIVQTQMRTRPLLHTTPCGHKNGGLNVPNFPDTPSRPASVRPHCLIPQAM